MPEQKTASNEDADSEVHPSEHTLKTREQTLSFSIGQFEVIPLNYPFFP